MTRTNVIQIGLIAFFIGAVGYGIFLALGLDGSKAGIASEAVLVCLIIAWIGSYFYRVVSGKMTFMEQRKRYRKAYEQLTKTSLEEKFDSMSEEEKIRLINELEIDKK
ncbi:DUF3007 family protein [Prochlorococcus marinus]|uniref:DUF3007 domain-containing protein n=1 Tax=Prochlorococcus marinus (strain MIT 9211) TaxID=93059 RepID=A9BEJ5_PROM4|nr:DUF3007 family protein [Prochlorococcus marinus]ABX08505.1 conserved hypothetical protein [Prochlorococcus marinus str. MIT 9211]